MLAYLDAGSASVGASMIAAGVAGVGVMARGAFGRLKRGKKVELPEMVEDDSTDGDLDVHESTAADADADS